MGYKLHEKSPSSGTTIIVDMNEKDMKFTILDSEDVGDALNIGYEKYIGGEWIDRLLRKRIMEKLEERNGTDGKELSLDEKLYEEVRKVRHTLRTKETTTVEVDNTKLTISRKDFDGIASPVYDHIITSLEKLVHDTRIGKGEVTTLIFIGTAISIPTLQNRIASRFKNAKILSTVLSG